VRQLDFSQGIHSGVYKMTVEIAGQAAAKIAEPYPQVRMFAFAGETWRQYLHADANKWAAMQRLAAYWGIATAEIAAFGDDCNDMDMLRHCGTGVAVANALEEVKAIADAVCGSNDDDGPAHWIAEHILKGERNDMTWKELYG